MLNRNYIGKMDGEKGMEFMAEESAQEKWSGKNKALHIVCWAFGMAGMAER